MLEAMLNGKSNAGTFVTRKPSELTLRASLLSSYLLMFFPAAFADVVKSVMNWFHRPRLHDRSSPVECEVASIALSQFHSVTY